MRSIGYALLGAIATIKNASRKTYGKKGEDIVAMSIHARDVGRMLTARADATGLVTALVHYDIGYLKTIENELNKWLDQHEDAALFHMRGSMDPLNGPNPNDVEQRHLLNAVQPYQPI